MEKLILSKNESENKAVNEAAKEVQTLIQMVFDSFVKIGCGELDNIGQLETIKRNPEDFIKSRLIKGKTVELQGLTVKEEKVKELIELTPKQKEFIKLFNRVYNELDDTAERCSKEFHVSVYPSKFQLIDNKVQPSEALKTELIDAGIVYADNKAQVKVYKEIESLIKKVNTLNGILVGRNETPGYKPIGLLSQFIKIEGGGVMKPNGYRIKETL